MTPEEADELILEYANLGGTIKMLKERRAKIAEAFPNGRTEGKIWAVYKSGGGMRKTLSMEALRKYLTPQVMELCSRVKRYSGSMRLVPKAKPKEKKP